MEGGEEGRKAVISSQFFSPPSRRSEEKGGKNERERERIRGGSAWNVSHFAIVGNDSRADARQMAHFSLYLSLSLLSHFCEKKIQF